MLYAGLYFVLYLIVKFKIQDSSTLVTARAEQQSSVVLKGQLTPLALCLLLLPHGVLILHSQSKCKRDIS